jgi:hypothetical protein
MIIKPTGQSTLPVPGKPLVIDPVKVYMDIPLFYATERGPVPWDHPIFCAKVFAETVLQVQNDILLAEQMGLVHIGFYYPRPARRRDGTPIEPERWSNHSYGLAEDWKGIVTKNGEFLGVDLLHGNPAVPTDLFMRIWNGCAEAIRKAGRRPEIINEGSWVHIGIWPEV